MAKMFVQHPRYPQQRVEWDTVEPGVCVLCGQNYRMVRDKIAAMTAEMAELRSKLDQLIKDSEPERPLGDLLDGAIDW